MAIMNIRVVPDPVLRQKAKRVRYDNGSIQRLIDDMIETLHAAGGVGLAAPQVGQLLRIVVIETPDDGLITLLNPEVVKRSGERIVIEGCLSIPGYEGDVKRSEMVTVKGRDRHGKEMRLKSNELLAQALEHEIDHLNGVLYVDLLENRSKLRKLENAESENDNA